jgi:hypothetical protein
MLDTLHAGDFLGFEVSGLVFDFVGVTFEGGETPSVVIGDRLRFINRNWLAVFGEIKVVEGWLFSDRRDRIRQLLVFAVRRGAAIVACRAHFQVLFNDVTTRTITKRSFTDLVVHVHWSSMGGLGEDPS